MILLLRSSGILAETVRAIDRMSYRQLTIITMEQEYRNRASAEKQQPYKQTFARHIKEVMFGANPSFHKTIIITKSSENLAVVVLNWVVCAINLFSHLQFTTISFVDRQIGGGFEEKKCIWKLWAVTPVFGNVDSWNLHFVCCLQLMLSVRPIIVQCVRIM